MPKRERTSDTFLCGSHLLKGLDFARRRLNFIFREDETKQAELAFFRVAGEAAFSESVE